MYKNSSIPSVNWQDIDFAATLGVYMAPSQRKVLREVAHFLRTGHSPQADARPLGLSKEDRLVGAAHLLSEETITHFIPSSSATRLKYTLLNQLQNDGILSLGVLEEVWGIIKDPEFHYAKKELEEVHRLAQGVAGKMEATQKRFGSQWVLCLEVLKAISLKCASVEE